MYILSYCLYGGSNKKAAVLPILDDSSKFGDGDDSGGDKADGSRGAEYTTQQKEMLQKTAKAMLPSSKLKGAERMQRIVREKLMSLQGKERQALLAKLAKQATDNDLELERAEEAELKNLEKANHDPVEYAKLIALRRQNVAYLRLRSLQHGRIVRDQEFQRHDMVRKEKIATLMEWFIENKTGIDQTVITDQLRQLDEENKKSVELLNERINDKLESEVKRVVEEDEKNWSATYQEELVEMKKADLNHGTLVKQELNENEVVKRQQLSRIVAAHSRIKEAELKLKEAPPNEAEAVAANVKRLNDAANIALERELSSTRRRALFFEDILSSQRGLSDDDGSLRSLNKREVTALKEKLRLKKKRDKERLKRLTTEEEYLARREHEGVGKELEEELRAIAEHHAEMEGDIDAKFSKSVDVTESEEKARQAALIASGCTVWEELAVLKAKHDADLSDLKAEMLALKEVDRSNLAARSRKEQQQLHTSLTGIGANSLDSVGSVMTPGRKMARKNSIIKAIDSHDNEMDRLYFSLEMRHKADLDRSLSEEKVRQEVCEGLEDDFECRLARLKESHEKEIGLLSDSLYAEQRRQRDRLRTRLANRKNKRRKELEEGASDAEVEKELGILDDEYKEDEKSLLKMTDEDIENRVMALRDAYSQEEKKLEDYDAMLINMKNEHDRNLSDMKRNLETDQKRQRELLKQRLMAKRAKRESESGGMGEASQKLLGKEEEEAMKEFEYLCEKSMHKLMNDSKLKLNQEVAEVRGDMKASKELFLTLHEDIDKIRKEHSEGISFLEAELELKNARARKSLQGQLERARLKRAAKASEDGENIEEAMGRLMVEQHGAEDDLEKELLSEEMGRKRELMEQFQEARLMKLKGTDQIINLQQDQMDEAKKLREEAVAAAKVLESEIKRMRAEKEAKLKERLSARRKKKESDLRKKGAGVEEMKLVESILLEEEVLEKDNLERELSEARAKLEFERDEAEKERLSKLRESEEEAAKDAERDAILAKERAVNEMEKLKREHAEGAKKRQDELEDKRNSKKRKLQKQLEKRKKMRENELAEKKKKVERELAAKKASEEEKERARKQLEQQAERARIAAEEESRRLTAELEANLEEEKKREEEAVKAEAARQEEELKKLQIEAANEAAAAVAKKKILEAANEARIAAEKEAKEAALEEEARESEKEAKRMLEKFEHDNERMERDKENEKERQRIILKKKLQQRKEMLKRRKEVKQSNLEATKKSLEKLEEVHRNQREELGVHMEKQGAGGASDDPKLVAELEKIKQELHIKEVELLETQGNLQDLQSDMDIMLADQQHKGDDSEAAIAKMASENLQIQKQLESCMKELQEARQIMDSKDTVPSSEYNNAKLELEKARESEADANAKLSESILTRHELEAEIKEGEAHALQLDEAMQVMERNLEASKQDHVREIEALESSKAQAISNLAEEKSKIQKVADRVVEAESSAKENQSKRDFFEARFNEILKQKKKLHNELSDMAGKIRVFARIRPLSAKELNSREKEACCYVNEQALSLTANFGAAADDATGMLDHTETREFEYDSVFGPSTTQEQIFEECSGMMDSCLDGYNSCVFAYGQTGAGKTWTMAGNDEAKSNWGLARRFIEYLFNEVDDQAAKGQSEIRVTCEYLEIYCEELKDLFYAMDNHKDKQKMKNPPKLQCGMDRDGRVVVKNIIEKECTSKEEMLAYFNEGNNHRHVHATAMNAESSRR